MHENPLGLQPHFGAALILKTIGESDFILNRGNKAFVSLPH
jgi:hypothetical protein